MIMVPRDLIATCAPDERVDAVRARNQARYCHWPVAEANGHIIGLLDLRQAVEGQVGAVMRTLDESVLIGADAAIVGYVREADVRPCKLVVSGGAIAGLVTTSDLQKLPVRAALFGLVTRLELAMMAAMEARLPDEARWLPLLTENRRQKLAYNIAEMRAGEHWVSPVLATQFVDKVNVVRHLLNGDAGRFRKDMRDVLRLRDQLAHAGTYATTLEQAARTCTATRAVERWLPTVEALAG